MIRWLMLGCLVGALVVVWAGFACAGSLVFVEKFYAGRVWGAAVADDGRLFASSDEYHRIHQLGPVLRGNTIVSHFANSTPSQSVRDTFHGFWDDNLQMRPYGEPWPGSWYRPTGMDAQDSLLYVVDTWNHRVQVITLELDLVSWFGDVSYPSDVATNDSLVFISDVIEHEVEVWDRMTGLYLRAFGSYGIRSDGMDYPRGLAISPVTGDLYVTNRNKVQRWTPDGTFVAAWGSSGTGPGEFLQPAGIDVDTFSNVYVMDFWGGRCQIFTEDGVYLQEFGVPWGSTHPPEHFRGYDVAVHPASVQPWEDPATDIYITDLHHEMVHHWRLTP